MKHRRIAVLCRPEIAAGFALAGLRPDEIDKPEQGTAAVRNLLRDPETGVLLVEDRFYAELPEDVRRELARRPVPLVVPFPGPVWQAPPEGPEAYIIELLRRVIGYRVRLR